MNAYDIETYLRGGEHTPFCICYIYKKQKRFFYLKSEDEDLVLFSLERMFLEKLKEKTVFYVHNLSFDGLLILNTISKTPRFTLQTFIKDLQIYSIKITYNGKTIEFKCSYKILPISLGNIAKSFNLPEKLPFPYKFSSWENLNYQGKIPSREFFNNPGEWERFHRMNTILDFKKWSIKYCFRDVEITSLFVESINKILESFHINIEKTYSAPSLSLKIFRKKFNKDQIKFSHNFFLDRFIRPGYYGGRCEIFGNPITSNFLFHFDFSGMYGLCMKEKFSYGGYKIFTKDLDINIPGYYYIKFYSKKDLLYPILPHRRVEDGKLMFTNGYMEGCYWYEEIKLFLEHGGEIIQILYGVIFEKHDYIFNEYIDFFQGIREKGGEYKTFAKLMVNSLYGRMGMNFITTHSFFTSEENLEKYLSKLNINSFVKLNQIVLIEAEINDKLAQLCDIKTARTKTNIGLAAAITSKARIKLYRSLMSVIKEGGRPLYSDTDSIFAEYPRDVSNESHGEIFFDASKKDTLITDAVFALPKTYGILYKNREEIIKIKGLNQDLSSFQDFKNKFYNEESFIIKNFRYLEKHDLLLLEKQIVKVFDLGKYDKRKFNKEKTHTTPYFYEDYKYS